MNISIKYKAIIHMNWLKHLNNILFHEIEDNDEQKILFDFFVYVSM